MKRWWHQNGFIVGAFVLPMILMLLVYAAFHVYPFGNGSVLVLDLNGQYVSYFEAFRDAFLGGKSLFYSFGRSLGGEMIGIVAYYLASPFTLLVLLFPKTHITEALFVMTLLKIGTSGLTCYIYLLKKRCSNLNKLLLSICYALCAYSVVQVMNLMWMDAVLILPILMLSVERLVETKKGHLFSFVLIYLFITNYYIAYMVGLLSFVYFLYYSVLYRNTVEKKALLIFFRQTVLSVLCTAFILIPTAYSLTLGKTEFTKPDLSVYSKFPFLDLFVKLLPSTYDSVNVQGLPFIYLGVLPLILVVLYFLNKNISLREKAASFAMLLFLVLIMNISTLDLLLHGMQNPNWLNYRYAFFVSFFLVILASRALEEQEGISDAMIAKTFFWLLGFVILIQAKHYDFVSSEATIWLSLACLVVYCGSWLLIRVKPKYEPMKYVVLLLVCAELFLNALSSLHALDYEVLYSTRDSYIPYMQEIRLPLSKLKNDDHSLYRVEKTFHRTVNDPLSLGMRGISHSSSTLHAHAIHFLKQMGYSARDHWTKYLGGTPLSDSLLGIKYVMSKEPLNIYDVIYRMENISVYENKQAMPLLYYASSELKNVSEEESPFVFQNAILSAMLNEPYTEYFEKVDVLRIETENVVSSSIASHTSYKPIDASRNAQVEFFFEGDEFSPTYVYFPSKYEREVNLWIDGAWVDTFFGNESYRIMNLGCGANEHSLIMTITNNEVYLKENLSYFYRLNQAKFASAIDRLKEGSLRISSFDERHIKGEVSASEDGMMFTSLPYEKGWTILVDGKKVDYYENLGALIAFDIKKGNHQISMTFFPYGMKLGIGLGLLGMACWILIYRQEKKKKSE